MTAEPQMMFVVDLTYTVPIEQVLEHIDPHMEFVHGLRDSGQLLVAGAKVPRTGGVMVLTGPSRDAIEALIDADPFKRAGVADYAVTEFKGGTLAPSLADTFGA